VADEPKQPWYKSIPGILTAATGLIAALSGLVAGLNQLGVFRRDPPAAVVSTTPAPADNTAQDTVRDFAGVRPMTPPGAALRPPAPNPAPPQSGASDKPSTAPKPTRQAPAADTANTGSVLVPKGTALSLTVPTRTCAPAEGARRLTARVAAAVEVNGATVIPAGTTAVLRLRRAADQPIPRVRLDSLVRSGRALPVSSSQVQIPRGWASGVCLRAGARLTAVLGDAVAVPRT
jgi:hypothetical protein